MTIVLGVLVLSSVATLDAQRRAPESAPATVAMTMALKAGEKIYNFSGQGQCVYAPVASIYGMRAERWTAARTGAAPNASLVVWHPATGQDMLAVAFTIGDTRYAMNTVKVGDKGTTEGAGAVTIKREGTGATFTLEGTASNGTPISGTVKCAAFTPASAEGGD